MTSAQAPKPAGWFSGRTRLVTVVSIVAVALAGATAVSANIGILDSATDSPVGDASVTGDLGAAPQVVDVRLPDTTVATTTSTTVGTAAPTVQEYAVDAAGLVGIATTNDGLRLDHVTPSAGWRWSLTQSDPAALLVTMTNGERTFEFTATMTADGNVVASVDEPIVTPAAGAPSVISRSDDHDDDDEHEDHDEHDDDEHDGDEHEEYEGGEDDD